MCARTRSKVLGSRRQARVLHSPQVLSESSVAAFRGVDQAVLEQLRQRGVTAASAADAGPGQAGHLDRLVLEARDAVHAEVA